MKPSILQGHTRPIKAISFNSNSTIAYSASNDRSIIAWDIDKKEKIKCFNHTAAINSFTLSSCDKYIVSGDNTGTVSIWDIEKNIILTIIDGDPTETVRSIGFSKDNTKLLISFSGRTKTSTSKLRIYDFLSLIEGSFTEVTKMDSFKEEKIDDGLKSESIYNQESIYSHNNTSNKKKKNSKEKEKKDPYANHIPKKLEIEKLTPVSEHICKNSKYTKALFVKNDELILAGREDGVLELLKSANGEIIYEKNIHSEAILDIDYLQNNDFILTSSSDGYAYVLGLANFQVFFKFHPESPTRNLNSCRLMLINNPFFDKKKVNVEDLFTSGENCLEDKFNLLRKECKLPIAVFAGGQDSKLVTTTHPKDGGFEIIVHELIQGNQLLYFQSHFGPINALGTAGLSTWLASGSEDSTVRLYNIEEYLRMLDM